MRNNVIALCLLLTGVGLGMALACFLLGIPILVPGGHDIGGIGMGIAVIGVIIAGTTITSPVPVGYLSD